MDKLNRYGWNVNTGTILVSGMIPVEKLKVDPTYQRDRLSEKNILGIARDFSWAAFRTLLVARRPNGELYVVDGQHRLEAAKRRGEKNVPCSIFESTGAEEEARAFYTCSVKTVHIPALNQYKALLTSGDPETLAIADMLFGLGLDIATNTTTNPNLLNFPSEIIRTYRIDPQMTVQALRLHRLMIGDGECMNHYIHKGIFYILRKLEGTGNAITKEMAAKVFQGGGKAVLLNSINATHAKTGNAGKGNDTCGAGVWAVIKKTCRCRFNLENVA